MDDAVKLRTRHKTRLRGRFRLETPLDREGITQLANEMAGIGGVRRARVRPNTCSLIIESAIPMDAVIAAIEEQGIARILSMSAPPPVGQTLQSGLLRVDGAVKRQTGGAFDLRSALATVLIIAALVQMTRGRLAGPATTLLMSALPLLDFQKIYETAD
ncbi:HMA2 domain-containing protein [Roseovarius salis]|uniref:HMA2 domain-containing protein n=1 Tax=Roseovarius salis TaxID=3376063 RepID=UPI0037C764A8